MHPRNSKEGAMQTCGKSPLHGGKGHEKREWEYELEATLSEYEVVELSMNEAVRLLKQLHQPAKFKGNKSSAYSEPEGS